MARTLKRKRTRRHKRKHNNNAITVKKGGGLWKDLKILIGVDVDYNDNGQPMFDGKTLKDQRPYKQIEKENNKFLGDGDRDSMTTQRYLPDVTGNLRDLPEFSERVNEMHEDNNYFIDEGIPEEKYLGQVAAEAYKDSKKPPKDSVKIQEYTGKRVDLKQGSKDTSIWEAILLGLAGVVLVGGITVLTEHIINSKHAHSS